MTLYQFIALDEMEQQEAIWEGVHIADRDDGEHKILLYQIVLFMLRFSIIRSIMLFENIYLLILLINLRHI